MEHKFSCPFHNKPCDDWCAARVDNDNGEYKFPCALVEAQYDMSMALHKIQHDGLHIIIEGSDLEISVDGPVKVEKIKG